MTATAADALAKLERARYLTLLEATAAQLLRDNPGEWTLPELLAEQERRLRRIADLLGEVRREWGACPARALAELRAAFHAWAGAPAPPGCPGDAGGGRGPRG